MAKGSSSSQSVMLAGYWYAALAAILWSFMGPLSKICYSSGVTALEIAFWRAVLGGICFFIQMGIQGGLRIPLRDASIFFLFGAVAISVLFGTLQVSIQQSGAAMALMLLYTAPVWVALASRMVFHEEISRPKIAAVCVALGGATLVCFSGGSLPKEASVPGILCGLFSGMAYASQFPFYIWWKNRYPISTIYTYMLLGGSLILLPFVDFADGKSWAAWGSLLTLGVVTNYCAYIALALSLQRISQVQTAVIGNIEPILATFWVWMFFGENFTTSGWVGCVFILGAVLLLTLERRRHPKTL